MLICAFCVLKLYDDFCNESGHSVCWLFFVHIGSLLHCVITVCIKCFQEGMPLKSWKKRWFVLADFCLFHYKGLSYEFLCSSKLFSVCFFALFCDSALERHFIFLWILLSVAVFNKRCLDYLLVWIWVKNFLKSLYSVVINFAYCIPVLKFTDSIYGVEIITCWHTQH